MEFPVYCIIYNRAVKAVRTPEGGVAVLSYSAAKDDFEPAMEVAHRIFYPGLETDFVSEEEFQAYVDRLRAQAKSRQQEDREKPG